MLSMTWRSDFPMYSISSLFRISNFRNLSFRVFGCKSIDQNCEALLCVATKIIVIKFYAEFKEKETSSEIFIHLIYDDTF